LCSSASSSSSESIGNPAFALFPAAPAAAVPRLLALLNPAPDPEAAGFDVREGADAVRVGFFFGGALIVAAAAAVVGAGGALRDGVREMGRGGLKAGRGFVDLGGMLDEVVVLNELTVVGLRRGGRLG